VSTDKQLVLDAIKSHPDWSVRKLARHLLITHPDQFTSINAARWMIRRINEYDIPGVKKIEEYKVTTSNEFIQYPEGTTFSPPAFDGTADLPSPPFTSDNKVRVKKVKRKITHKGIELRISIRLRT
jgi:hypothetical protein